jgi:hypothetical protein
MDLTAHTRSDQKRAAARLHAIATLTMPGGLIYNVGFNKAEHEMVETQVQDVLRVDKVLTEKAERIQAIRWLPDENWCPIVYERI